MNKNKIILISINSILIIVIVLLYWYLIKNRLYNNQPFKNIWSPHKKEKIKKLLLKSEECFKNLNIEFIPAFGTLLGLIRNKGIIPWDDDMDISVDIKDFDKILEHKELFESVGVGVFLYKKLFNNKFIKLYLLSEKKIPDHEWSWPFIDIFIHYLENQNFIITDNMNTTKLDKNEIYPLKTNLFENIPMNIPKNVDYILNKYYGNDWEDVCYSSPYNHQNEKHYLKQYKINCNEISHVDNSIFNNVWVINLERRLDRLKNTIDRLKKIKINPHIWKATDSKTQEMEKIYKNIKGLKTSIGECATYLSHKKLWTHIYSLNIPYAIIFEDDITIPSIVDKKIILSQINESLGFSVLFLGYCGSNVSSIQCCNPKIGRASCTHAYVISRDAIKKLLSYENDFSLPIDTELKNFCKNNLCFLSYNIEDEENFGEGIIKQDNSIKSDLENKHVVYSI